ncbi:uncharacterized protein [Prorops nasuta]|uniref:uncharacterized protein n=1 Tax=Prorops nasuta TaxID=863751 RepID=UPI0034D01B34
MELHTPKRESRPLTETLPCSPPMCDTMLYPWNWGEEARNVNLSPGSSCSSPEYRDIVGTRPGGPRSGGGASESHRRGRPRADALSNLMMQGSTSPSSIKCSYCNRVFPREKSLQAHLRTHTGERPYPCDYPGCTKAFTQSGQLKTHQRLHTGEKPFLCTEPGCEMRFTHANRHCPEHPYATLTRSDDFVLKPVSDNTELPHDVTRWLERYKMARERDEKTPTGKNDRKKKSWKSSTENHKKVKSRKGLMMDDTGEQENLDRKPSQRLYCLDGQDSQEESQDEDPAETCTALHTSEDEEPLTTKLHNTPVRRPLDRLQPKKRWLREACLEQQLAKPLNWDARSNNNTQTALCSNNNVKLFNASDSPQSQWNLSLVENSSVTSESSFYLNIDSEILIKSEDDANRTNIHPWIKSLNESSPQQFSTLKEIQSNNEQCDATDTDWDSQQKMSSNSSLITTGYWNQNSLNDISNTISEQSFPRMNKFSENETRPTVLMLAGSYNKHCDKKNTSKVFDYNKPGSKVTVAKQEDSLPKVPLPDDNKKWMGALALMELAKTQKEAAKALSLQKDTGLNYTHL